MKLNLSKFKKVKSDKDFTTLRHEDGHEMKIRHSALSPKLRGELHKMPGQMNSGAASQSMPMKDGGDVSDEAIKHKQEIDDYNKTHEDEPKEYPQDVTVTLQKAKDVTPRRNYDGGGDVGPTLGSVIGYPGAEQTAPKPKPKYAGGTTDVQAPAPIDPTVAKNIQNDLKVAPAPTSTPTSTTSSPWIYDAGDPKAEAEHQAAVAAHQKWLDANPPAPTAPAPEEANPAWPRPPMAKGGKVAHYAEGSTDVDASDADSSDKPQAPVTINIGGATPQQSQPGGSQPGPQATPGANPPQGPTPSGATLDQSQAPASPQGQAPQAPQGQPGQPQQGMAQPQPGQPQQPQIGPPDMFTGYQQQVQGLADQAAAEGKMGQDEAQAFKTSIPMQKAAFERFQKTSQSVMDDYQNTMAELASNDPKNKIDPNQFWDSKTIPQKIIAAIALTGAGAFAGITGQKNPLMDFFNQQIERNLDAQKSNINKKFNLLGHLHQQMGDLNTAADLYRLYSQGAIKNELDAAAAKAQNPMAQARLLQAKGQLEMQQAPMFMRTMMMHSLMDPKQGAGGQPGQPQQLDTRDPAEAVPYMVPEGQQPAVFKEIGDATNARRSFGEIMDAYKKASDAMTGLGRVGAAFKEPREVARLRQLLGTTVTAQTGSARQAEFDNVNNNLIPNKYDNDHDKAVRDQAIREYMTAKMAAPMAKGYHIDLDKFKSTSLVPFTNEGRLTPQQQTWAAIARANPNHPQSKEMLKKLGLEK